MDKVGLAGLGTYPSCDGVRPVKVGADRESAWEEVSLNSVEDENTDVAGAGGAALRFAAGAAGESLDRGP
jgi:hypothetical protein